MADGAAGSLSDEAVRQRLNRLDDLLAQLENMPGPATDRALDAITLLTQIYGAALQRVMDRVSADAGLVERILADELLDHLLVLHGISPVPVEERIARALDALRPHLRSQDRDAELAGIVDGVATVRVTGGSMGCASTAANLEIAVTDAVLAAAPELSRVEAALETPARPETLIPVESLRHRPMAQAPGAS